MSLASTGIETLVQFGCPVGQATVGLVNAGLSSRLWTWVTSPAGSGPELVIAVLVQPTPVEGSQPGGGVLAFGAFTVSNSTPAEAVESLEATVLFRKSTITASWIDTPPPFQPETLLTMMLLVTDSENQWDGALGLLNMSLPLMLCSRRPPPSPLSAVLPMIRLASTTLPPPMPSDRGGLPARSIWLFSANVPSGALPSRMSPPPLVVSVGFWLWLNRK